MSHAPGIVPPAGPRPGVTPLRGKANLDLRRRLAPYLLLLPAVVCLLPFAIALLAAAQGTVLWGAGGLQGALAHYLKFFTDKLYLTYLYRSFKVATYATPIVLLLAYPVAYVMARSSPRVRLWFSIILVVQFLSGYVVRAYALMVILGSQGLVNRLLLALGLVEQPIRFLYNEKGVIVGVVAVAFPFMVFPIFSVLRNLQPSLESAAQSLGAAPLRAFWHVTLPLSLPGIAAGVLLVYVFALTSFVIPGLLGGGYYDMMANMIYDQALGGMNFPFAAAGAVIMLTVTLVVVYLLNRGFARLSPDTAAH